MFDLVKGFLIFDRGIPNSDASLIRHSTRGTVANGEDTLEVPLLHDK